MKITNVSVTDHGVQVVCEAYSQIVLDNARSVVLEGDIGWGRHLQHAEQLKKDLPTILPGFKLVRVDGFQNGNVLKRQYSFEKELT